MFETFLKLILQLIFYISSMMNSILINPILWLFNAIYPNFNTWLGDSIVFWQRLLNGVNFAKEVFLNVTGFPRSLFILIVGFYFLKFSLMLPIRAYKFLINLYFIIRGNRAIAK